MFANEVVILGCNVPRIGLGSRRYVAVGGRRVDLRLYKNQAWTTLPDKDLATDWYGIFTRTLQTSLAHGTYAYA